MASRPIDLGAVNVFVGGNNAGKSSLIQGLHFSDIDCGSDSAPFGPERETDGSRFLKTFTVGG
jgi:AAA15 family ATPase/GTPase